MKKKKICYALIGSQAGLTLPEVMVVVAILSTLSLLFYSLVVGTMRTNMLLEAENSLTSYGQRTINILKTEVAQSRRIYENNSHQLLSLAYCRCYSSKAKGCARR